MPDQPVYSEEFACSERLARFLSSPLFEAIIFSQLHTALRSITGRDM